MERFMLERPVLAVDVVIFSINQDGLRVLLTRRSEEPFQDAPALPEVAVRVDETLEQAAKRAMREKIGWSETERERVYLEQLATFDAIYRDPRGRTVSVAYLGIVGKNGAESSPILWETVSDIANGTLPLITA